MPPRMGFFFHGNRGLCHNRPISRGIAMPSMNISRNLDLVFCIDGTGSMRPIMDDIKENAIRLYSQLVEECYVHGASVGALRVKVITFRDYESEGEDAIDESPFFELPDDDDLFSEHLKSIVPGGGAGKGACGYEALHYAMRGEFVHGPKDRQIIVLITDTYPPYPPWQADGAFRPRGFGISRPGHVYERIHLPTRGEEQRPFRYGFLSHRPHRRRFRRRSISSFILLRHAAYRGAFFFAPIALFLRA